MRGEHHPQRLSALLRILAPYLRARWKQFALMIALAPLSSLAAMIVPFLIKIAIDNHLLPALEQGSLDGQLPSLLRLCAIAMIVVVFGYLADALYLSLMQRTGQGLLANLRREAYCHSLRLPRSYYDNHPIGGVLTRVTSDVEALGESLSNHTMQLVVELLKSLAFVGMMLFLSVPLTLVLLVLLPLLVWTMRFFQQRIRRVFFMSRRALSEATSYLQEGLAGIKTVQLFGLEAHVMGNFRMLNKRFYRMQNLSNFHDAALFSIVEGVTGVALALVLWYAAGQLIAGVITLGVLIAFLEYIQRLFVPLREFSQQMAVLQRALAALDHINGLFLEPQDVAEQKASPSVVVSSTRRTSRRDKATREAAGAGSAAGAENAAGAGSATDTGTGQLRPGAVDATPEEFHLDATTPVEDVPALDFHNVRFAYSSRGGEVLRGVSFHLPAKGSLAIVGPTGSGKSTLIRLLTRVYHNWEGEIRLNGMDLTRYPAESLGRRIAVVHQGVFLFRGSVAFNIGLGRPGITRARIEEAARYVYAHRFIAELDGGYDFVVQSGGTNLSAGQAQLLAFARAVVTGAGLIVLDEATSSVDSLTESWIQKAIHRFYQDKSTIAIAHRLSTIRQADTILVMVAGEIVERGDHETLLAKQGVYTSLLGELGEPRAPV